jgi:cytochrome c biogenesis protein CcmG/thiol:disulfide interchange protein DsbE
MHRPQAQLRTLLAGAGVAAVFVAFVIFGLAGSGGRNGRPAPPLPREHLSGLPVTLMALRGHPVLVTFWASWCTPCEHEAPSLERFSRGLRGRATLVGVNWEDLSLTNARSFLRSYRWTFSNVRDVDGTVGREYGVTGLPTTFAIDSAGRIRAELHGPQTQQTLTGALATVGR